MKHVLTLVALLSLGAAHTNHKAEALDLCDQIITHVTQKGEKAKDAISLAGQLKDLIIGTQDSAIPYDLVPTLQAVNQSPLVLFYIEKKLMKAAQSMPVAG